MTMTQRQAALAHGWRSGLEHRVADSLTDRGAIFVYEARSLTYTVPERKRKYTPDFFIVTASGKEIIVETKGRWLRADRLKMKLVVEQHPHLEIRMVFQNPNAPISKGSKTTYAAWCDRHLGIPWAKGDVPDAWIME